jgi:hypothetical protein
VFAEAPPLPQPLISNKISTKMALANTKAPGNKLAGEKEMRFTKRSLDAWFTPGHGKRNETTPYNSGGINKKNKVLPSLLN